eukprot:TRINITY_DN19528_c0_g1_i1.p1 TRINITY_DN19528_c0_g1~~TRINITY_DN19528_c0_g1_i1.p1  ORF type:complete len:300 (-),score=76.97 TRINITY_DN19528_c0_g1_i1:64-963(-)
MASVGAYAVPMILSGLVTNQMEDEQDDGESVYQIHGVPCMFKNTFLCVAEAASPRGASRRSSSSPPALARERELCSSRAPLLSEEGAKERGSSTESTAGLTDEEDSSSISDAASDAAVSLSLVSLLPASEASPPPRRALDSRARAWAPGQRKVWGAPPGIQQGFNEVVSAVRLALESCAGTQQATSDVAATTAAVVATSLSQHPLCVQHSLAVAKQAMLDAAERSSCGVYVLGYEAQPFTTSPSGLSFTATLAHVQDEGSACWDLLTRGCCMRQCACRWQHPSWQMCVNVSIEFGNAVG